MACCIAFITSINTEQNKIWETLNMKNSLNSGYWSLSVTWCTHLHVAQQIWHKSSLHISTLSNSLTFWDVMGLTWENWYHAQVLELFPAGHSWYKMEQDATCSFVKVLVDRVTFRWSHAHSFISKQVRNNQHSYHLSGKCFQEKSNYCILIDNKLKKKILLHPSV